MIRDTITLGTLGGTHSAVNQDWKKPGQALGYTLLDTLGSAALGYAGGKAFEKLDDVIKAYADDWHSSVPTKPTGSMKWPNSKEELFANAGKNGYSGGAGKVVIDNTPIVMVGQWMSKAEYYSCLYKVEEIKMLNTIKNFLVNHAKSSSAIKLEDAVIYDGKKLAVIISKKDYMASFEVTPNWEYDMLVINSNDEAIVFNKSKELNDIQELFAELEADYNAFAEQ